MRTHREYVQSAYIGAATLTPMRRPDLAVPLLISLALGCVVACAGRQASPSASAPGLADFYPLSAGNAWSYDVDTGDASTTLATTRVESSVEGFAVVRTGESVVQYELSPHGIRLASEKAWLIRSPLRVGSSWPARGGRSAQLVSTDTSIETPAGAFVACLEVVERGGELDLEVRTVYCPRVGPVFVASTMRSNTSDRSVTVSASLRGFSVRPSSSSPR